MVRAILGLIRASSILLDAEQEKDARLHLTRWLVKGDVDAVLKQLSEQRQLCAPLEDSVDGEDDSS